MVTIKCPECQADVPAGAFCAQCGAHLTAKRNRLRREAFALAPQQHVLRPDLASSMFFDLPRRSRVPYRIGLVLLLAVLFGFAGFRLIAVMIAVAALGLPLLFLLYLTEPETRQQLSRWSLAMTASLAATLAIAWILLSGAFVARSYGVPIAASLAMHHLVRESLTIPLGAALLMLAPIIITRIVRSKPRESLNGFVIGSAAALTFAGVATLTRLGPQFAVGIFERHRPISGLFIEATISGVTIPLTAAASGGLFGMALWFKGSTGAHKHPALTRVALLLLTGLALLAHLSVALMDMLAIPQIAMLGAHIAMTLLVLIALRIGQQLAVLQETHVPVADPDPLLCPNCEQPESDLPFCPSCGFAIQAVSRTTEITRPRFRRTLGAWTAIVTAVASGLVAASLIAPHKPPRFNCPPDCGRPTMGGTPVAALPRFTAPSGAFSVSYPASGSAYEITTDANGVTAKYIAGDTGYLQLFSQPARGRSARDIAKALIKNKFPDAKTAFELPNASVGYQPGYGEVADIWPQGSSTRIRTILLVAVKNDLALAAGAVGPYHQFGPDFGPGLPSGVDLEIAEDMGKYVNSFAWAGDPPR